MGYGSPAFTTDGPDFHYYSRVFLLHVYDRVYTAKSDPLCAAAADPNADCGSAYSSSGRDTPCFAACFNHNYGAVRLLVARGARPDHCRILCDCPDSIPHPQKCMCVQCGVKWSQ